MSAQALLSYKLNWQSVMFVGYGDDRELTDRDQFVKSGRQVFVKLSYALQRYGGRSHEKAFCLIRLATPL